MYRIPSVGRVARGCVISHVTCAKTFVSPNATYTQPHSEPNCMEILRNSLNKRPSKRCSNKQIGKWKEKLTEKNNGENHKTYFIASQTFYYKIFLTRR